MGNNGLGINAYSGPMGQKEPAYGMAETMKQLGRIGVQGTAAQNAPRRSQRRAQRGKRAAPAQTPPAPQVAPEMAPVGNYDQELVQFWTALAAEPGASEMIQQMAQKVVANG